MKQTVRYKTFETNSSSYHTLTLRTISEKPQLKFIEKGKDLVIDTNIKYHTIGNSSSYSFTSQNNYQRAQLLLRSLGSKIEKQMYDLGLYGDKNLFLQKYEAVPILSAFIKAIKKYIGEDKNVNIVFDRIFCPYFECEYFEYLPESLDLDFNNVEEMIPVFNNIIFNDNIELTEECESNE